MLALQYTPSVPRHVAARFSPKIGVGALRLMDVDPPRLPGPGWELVRPRLSGICAISVRRPVLTRSMVMAVMPLSSLVGCRR